MRAHLSQEASMNGQSTTLISRAIPKASGLILSLVAGWSFAQVPVDEDGNPIAYSEQGTAAEVAAAAPGTVISSTDLETLVGPIALYPDDLLAIVLPASTYPLEIVQAARFLELLESNSGLEPDEEWDESVVALLNYPDVIKLMNDDIDWTWRLGDAVISQQSDVIAAVESFRDRAYAAGNLKSDDRQTVSNDEGVIEIIPVSEEIIYVPYYEPAEVVVYQPRPVYYYYPDPYPSYYYPYAAGHRFRSPYFWGVTTAFSIGWSNHYLNVYHPSYFGHPYYGHHYNYYGHYYRRPSINVYNNWYVNNNRFSSSNRHRDGDYWRPRNRAGSRPAEPRVTNYHYPPGSDERRDRDRTSRSSLDNRDNGRIDLNMRQRSNTERSRIAAASAGSRDRGDRVRVGSQSDERRAINTRSANNDARRDRAATNNATNNRVGNGGAERRSNRATRSSDAARAEIDRSNRSRVAPSNSTGNSNSNRTGTRENRGSSRSGNEANRGGNRDAIQFRDRGAENRVANSRTANSNTGNRATQSRNTVRQSQSNRGTTTANNQIAFAPRSSQSRANTGRSRAVSPSGQQRTTTSRSSNRGLAAPTRSVAPRATAPARISAPRSSAPARSSAPRSAAPRVSGPSRSAPTRSSAPSRSSAPRASAPARSAAPSRSSAPRASAPRAPSSSGRSSSSNRGSSSSSRRGSSRPRNNDS